MNDEFPGNLLGPTPEQKNAMTEAAFKDAFQGCGHNCSCDKHEITSMRQREPAQCHDCGCYEGELHAPGCDMERCPFCGGQLISCDCCYKLLGIDVSPGTWAYTNGLTEEQQTVWDEMLVAKGLVPYIRFPNLCCYCGKLWPDMFRVPDEEWEKYIPLEHRGDMLCKECYDLIKEMIDRAELDRANEV